MSRQLVLMLVPLVLVLLVVVVALATRRRITGQLYAGAGLEEWREVAAGLPWRDRWALYRANSRGRAASPRLAGLAVHRGKAMLACIEITTAPSSKFRRLWLVLGGSWLLLCALSVAMLVAGEREWHQWAQVIGQGSLGVAWLAMPAIQGRAAGKLARSVERNRELASPQRLDDMR